MLGDPFSVDITRLTVGYLEDADKEVSDCFSLPEIRNATNPIMILYPLRMPELTRMFNYVNDRLLMYLNQRE